MARAAQLARCDPAARDANRREARRNAVRLERWIVRRGGRSTNLCAELGLAPGTLRQWARRWRAERASHSAPSRRPGRPRGELTREQRQDALRLLRETQGRVGVLAMIEVLPPPVARNALANLKARWRYAAHRRGGRLCARLVWTRAGSVWAMDWTDPEAHLDGCYAKVLVVRDLASGETLLALPCPKEDGATVARELAVLFARHGAPAVLKSDNGGSLCCEAVQLLLAHHGVLLLRSPPACPGYNGACEAGIGSLKVAAHHIATAAGRELAQSCDDWDAARRAVNTRLRETGLSAEDSWRTRRPFGPREREDLWHRYRTHYAAERAARGFAPDAELRPMQHASLDRAAIARALEEVGLVKYRRHWIRPPIRGRKASRVS